MAASATMGSLLQSLEDFQQGPTTGEVGGGGGGGGGGSVSNDVLDRVEEFVEVPNTEFVALIVGRNGHKIKAIRERTDTFIKTPLRNEQPVFKIAGHIQNVSKAKQEILGIVQRLRSPQYRMGALLGDDPQEQRLTSNVRVPFKFVGLVVGFQGSTIMEIQFKTKTHIQTPAHGGEPIFQITGEWAESGKGLNTYFLLCVCASDIVLQSGQNRLINSHLIACCSPSLSSSR